MMSTMVITFLISFFYEHVEEFGKLLVHLLQPVVENTHE